MNWILSAVQLSARQLLTDRILNRNGPNRALGCAETTLFAKLGFDDGLFIL
jgi:hypothetical protein